MEGGGEYWASQRGLSQWFPSEMALRRLDAVGHGLLYLLLI
jgi:hypothetical protein